MVGAGSIREKLLVALLSVAGGGLAVLAATRTWATQTVPGLPASASAGVTGSDAVPQVTALALVAIAAGIVLGTAGRAGRLIAAAVLLLVGVGIPAGVLPELGGDVSTSEFNGWAWVAVAGGLLAALAGTLGLARSRTWPAPARRFERAGAPVGGQADPEVDRNHADSDDVWARLSRGDDPT
jgi:hypothetical protein